MRLSGAFSSWLDVHIDAYIFILMYCYVSYIHKCLHIFYVHTCIVHICMHPSIYTRTRTHTHTQTHIHSAHVDNIYVQKVNKLCAECKQSVCTCSQWLHVTSLIIRSMAWRNQITVFSLIATEQPITRIVRKWSM